jgi:hypothetical protein
MASTINENKRGDLQENSKYRRNPKRHDAQDGLRQTNEVKKAQPKGNVKEDLYQAATSKNKAYIEEGLKYLDKKIESIARKSETLASNEREILLSKKLLEYMEGLKKELLEREKEVNHILNEKRR